MKTYTLNGISYSDYPPIIDELLRNDKVNEAITLLNQLLEIIEKESKENSLGVAPWYYEKLANIYKKLHDKNKEIDILKRFSKQIHAPGVKPPRLLERLNNLISNAENIK